MKSITSKDLHSRHRSREIFWGVIIFVVIIFLLSFIPQKTKIIKVNEESAEVEVIKNIKLAFGGDIMLDRGVKNSVYKNFGGNYGELFSKVRTELRSYDILFANLEGPISDHGADEGGIYSFRMEPRVVPILKDAGFDVFSVANNHIFNWGETAFIDTLQSISENGMVYVGGGFVGTKAYQGKVVNVEEVKIAFLAFSEFTAGGTMSSSTKPGIAVISDTDIIESVSRARVGNDLVVVSFHFGTEYEPLPNAYQIKYAKLAVDFGADLIIGHHPHVVQTLEQYKNSYIIYSLGNFIFDQYFSPDTMQGGLLEVDVNPQTKKIEKVVLKKVKLNEMFQVEGIE